MGLTSLRLLKPDAVPTVHLKVPPTDKGSESTQETQRVIRSKGGLHENPDRQEFKYRLRSYILGHNEGAHSENGNVSVDVTPDLKLEEESFSGKIFSIVKANKIIIEPEKDLQMAYENLSGYIYHLLKKPIPNLEDDSKDDGLWVQRLDEGGLSKPPEEDQISAQRPFASPDTTSIKAPEGEGCPRCGGMVFAAEQQLSKGKMWHQKCFNCAECHRPLDSMLACDGPDKEIHCKACYGKLFGPKGFGYGHTPTLVSTGGESTVSFPEGGLLHGAKSSGGCPRCGFDVFAAERMISKSRVWHKRCFHCAFCRKSLDSTNLNDGPDGDIYCRSCYGRNFGPKGVGYGLGAGTLTMA